MSLVIGNLSYNSDRVTARFTYREYIYSSSDNLGDIDTSGYFNGAKHMLNSGDQILVTANDDKGLFVVIDSNTSSVVTMKRATVVDF